MIFLACCLLCSVFTIRVNASSNVSIWSRLVGYNFNPTPFAFPSVSTVANYTFDTIDSCQSKCELDPGCDFYTYNTLTNICDIKFTDKTANVSTVFAGQTSGQLFGQLRFANVINSIPTVLPSVNLCVDLCIATSNCQFVENDIHFSAVSCTMKFFDTDKNTTIGFRQDPRPLNFNPAILGRVDVIGNSGIVCIFANLLPNGRVLCGAQPEYFRGGVNGDNLLTPFSDSIQSNGIHNVPFGEIASIFDPITGIHRPSPVDENIFGHGAILAEDGSLFSAGGDSNTAPAAAGLNIGTGSMRWFDYTTEKWTYGQNMRTTRTNPTIIRLVNGSYVIIGGLVSGSSLTPQRSIEFFNPNTNFANTLLFSEVLDLTGTSTYPKCYLIPGSGDIFIFSYNTFEIISKDTGELIEREIDFNDQGLFSPEVVQGIRSGSFIGGNCLLPLWAARGYSAEIALFGGGNTNFNTNQSARNDVARMVITAPAPKRWTYDTDSMPYGRVASDCTLQPNGKILITNGARLGSVGGAPGHPTMAAAANGIMN